MRTTGAAVRTLARTVAKLGLRAGLSVLSPKRREQFKAWSELRFWRKVYRVTGNDTTRLAHERAHYERFFTSFFGLTRADYAGRRVLDIGCGPMGSLEWCDEAAERVGLDPLSDAYAALGARHHAMRYCAAPSEAIPFPDGHFDIVTSFNSLDHVVCPDRTIAEIRRVLRPGGTALIITEIGHAPTPTEPHQLDVGLLTRLGPGMRIEQVQCYGVRPDHQIYASLDDRVPYTTGRPGLLCAKLVRDLSISAPILDPVALAA